MERPLRPEEVSLGKEGHRSRRPAGPRSCVTSIQSSPQFLGMGPTHSSLKKILKTTQKMGTQSRVCISNTVLLAYGLNAVAHTGQTRRAWVDFSGVYMGAPLPRPITARRQGEPE